MPNIPDIHALWIGKRLGPLEEACLQSFTTHGHKVSVHSYAPLQGLSKNISNLDAAEIISGDEIFRHRETNSLGMFSDIFRYELFAKIRGAIYVDCDVYCLRAVTAEDNVFGFEMKNQLNGAVLALCPDSKLLHHLRQMRHTAHTRWPWEKRFPFAPLRPSLYWKKSENPLSDKLWATTGPLALTYWARKLGLFDVAKPIDYFYPLSFKRVAKLFVPGSSIEAIATQETRCIHLYNEAMKSAGLNLASVPRSSALGQILNAA